MQTLLQAGFVSVDEVDGALIVGFADRQFETSQYFMLQRSLDADDDEGVYVERRDQAYGTYAQVSSCTLSESRIELTLDGTSAQILETEPAFAVEFTCDQSLLDRLQNGLQRVFAGTNCRLQLPSRPPVGEELE